ncbi:hypothetical protein EBR43_12260 [bacterium]|nr:hypothetical protein [bacterium]
MDLIQGGKKNFNGYVPAPNVVKDILKVLCFSPLLASCEDYKAFVKSMLTGSENKTTASKVALSIVLTTGLTATYAYACDLVDDMYASYENTSKSF